MLTPSFFLNIFLICFILSLFVYLGLDNARRSWICRKENILRTRNGETATKDHRRRKPVVARARLKRVSEGHRMMYVLRVWFRRTGEMMVFSAPTHNGVLGELNRWLAESGAKIASELIPAPQKRRW